MDSRHSPSRASTRLALLAALVTGGCDETLPPEDAPPRPFLSAAVVSDPAAAPATSAAALSGSASAPVVYVSLPPGTFPDAVQATVRNPHRRRPHHRHGGRGLRSRPGPGNRG
jgi:hypothetical protein